MNRRFVPCSFLFAALALTGILAGALTGVPAAAQDGPESAAPADAPETRIEVDEDTGIIRFIINGKEQARLTESGLYVRGDIEYGGRQRGRRGLAVGAGDGQHGAPVHDGAQRLRALEHWYATLTRRCQFRMALRVPVPDTPPVPRVS